MKVRRGNLIRLRQTRGWSVRHLASLAGLQYKTIYDVERGTITNPQPKTVKALADALGVEMDEIAEVGLPDESVSA